jgi:uncharacterized phage-associated protein
MPSIDLAPTCQKTKPAEGFPATTNRHYLAAMTTAASVLTAIDVSRPGLSDTKRHLLLFFCQGHHLGYTANALFPEAIYATASGVDIDLPDVPDIQEPNSGALNLIGGVLSRYGELSPADLRTLIQASMPWQLAMKASGEPRIEWAWLRDWFTRPDENDDPADSRPTKTQLEAWAARV